jgi:hypothetical protein
MVSSFEIYDDVEDIRGELFGFISKIRRRDQNESKTKLSSQIRLSKVD